jgi:hypothetical protein
MGRQRCVDDGLRIAVLLSILIFAKLAVGQDPSTLLLRLQRSKAYLNIDSNVQHAQGMNGVTYGNPGDVFNYPNSLSCLVVHTDGTYILEKREEQTLGKPKVKRAEGTIAPDDLQRLKAILDEDGIKIIVSQKMPPLPDDAVSIREIESLDAQIERGGNAQHFTTVKERVKTRATTGMDSFVDNGTRFQKALNPLSKWFDNLEKKSRSELKDAKPQYCVPMNIG